MKKILGLILLFAMLTLGYAKSSNTGTYSIKCYKCYERAQKEHYIGCCPGCMAWRMHGEEKGDGWMVYHCEHGHKLYVSTKSEDRK